MQKKLLKYAVDIVQFVAVVRIHR